MRPNPPKPTKSELLAELESIRYSLSEEEIEQLMQQEECEIPVLVESVEDAGPGQSFSSQTAILALSAVDAPFEDALDFEGDSGFEGDLVFDDTGPRPRTATKISYPGANGAGNKDEPDSGFFPGRLAEDEERNVQHSSCEANSLEQTNPIDEKHEPLEPSPGQQSLFKQAAPEPKEGKNFFKPSSATPGEENPFLPKHIRDRLSQGRSTIMEELMQVGDSLNRDKNQFKFPPVNTKSEIPTYPASRQHSPAEIDRVIDEVIAEYLPRLETELRKRLRKQLSQSRQS